MKLRYTPIWLVLTFALLAFTPSKPAQATIVEIQTSLGNFEVNLSDTSTPLTVANFLEYVNNGLYTNSIIHRSVPGFVVQGGGFTFDQMIPFDTVPAFDTVDNEPEFSNLRGTIAMAKIGGDANSATSQWFINLADNSALLDNQNGGFTVFGQVVGDGMDVVDAMAGIPIFNLGSPFDELPLNNFTSNDANDIVADNLVVVTGVVVTDSTVDTSATLNLSENTLINPVTPVTPPTTTPTDSGGGGGSAGLGAIFLLLLLGLRNARLSRQ